VGLDSKVFDWIFCCMHFVVCKLGNYQRFGVWITRFCFDLCWWIDVKNEVDSRFKIQLDLNIVRLKRSKNFRIKSRFALYRGQFWRFLCWRDQKLFALNQGSHYIEIRLYTFFFVKNRPQNIQKFYMTKKLPPKIQQNPHTFPHYIRTFNSTQNPQKFKTSLKIPN
jgi:hypothetical protein